MIYAVAALWGGAFAVWVLLDAAWFILALLILASGPAILDLIRNPTARIEVWPRRIVWASALVDGDHRDVDHVRLDRRFDGTMKITLIHVGGGHTRLPPDVAPPVDALEAALAQAGIAAERHPFSPF